jgi:hypothetical protein
MSLGNLTSVELTRVLVTLAWNSHSGHLELSKKTVGEIKLFKKSFKTPLGKLDDCSPVGPRLSDLARVLLLLVVGW